MLTLTGTFMKLDDMSFVVPNSDEWEDFIQIPESEIGKAKPYDQVVCQIKKENASGNQVQGTIKDVIGLKWEKSIDLSSILKEQDIPEQFSKKALRQADSLLEDITERERAKRVDMSDQFIFTIDHASSQDLDDALSIECLSNGNQLLGVHIADVSHYIPEGSRLDEEARMRATSIYLADNVIPMLPKSISHQLCSLQPNRKKLALSVFIEVDDEGLVVESSIKETIIESKIRLTHDDVNHFFKEGNLPNISESGPLKSSLIELNTLAQKLKEKRLKRGAIHFGFSSPKIEIDHYGQVVDVRAHNKDISHQIIEECMLLCNESIATYATKHNLPFLYRIHKGPRPDRLLRLESFLFQHNYPALNIDKIDSQSCQALIQLGKERDQAETILLLLLKSMSQAYYGTLPIGHFGLNIPHYTHFTAPIRRYPDLYIHRLLKAHLRGELTSKRKDVLEPVLDRIAHHVSIQERKVDRVEKEYNLMRILEFMNQQVGEIYEGTIVALSHSYLHVTLSNGVDGRIPISYMTEDDFDYNEEHLAWEGKYTNSTLRLGDRMKVRISDVDLEDREILLQPMSHERNLIA